MIRRDANWNVGTNLPPIGSTPYQGMPSRGLSVCALPPIGAPYGERRASGPAVPTPAISTASYLHVGLYLTSGGRHSFVQRDAKAAQSLLHQLRPERLFAQKHLMIASRGSVTAIPCAFIERVELRPQLRRPFAPTPALHNTAWLSVSDSASRDSARRARASKARSMAWPIRERQTAPTPTSRRAWFSSLCKVPYRVVLVAAIIADANP